MACLWICVLELLYIAQSLGLAEYKIGIIAPRDCCRWTSLYHAGGAISLAIDQLNQDHVTDDVQFRIIVKDTFDEDDGVANVVSLVRDDDVDVIFGSPSSKVSIPSAHLTCNWNFPQISWVSTSHELSDKTRFATYVRTIGTYSTAALAFVSLFEKFNWKRVGLLHVDKETCLYANEGFADRFREANITIAQRIQYDRDVMHPSDIDTYLGMLSLTSRIIILCDTVHIRDILIRACELNMCNGEYVFLMPALSAAMDFETTRPWYKGDGRDEAARNAYRYFLYVTLANWYTADGRQKFEQFSRDVIERTAEPPWNNDYAKVNNIPASVYSQNLFDAMYLYGLWVNHTRRTGTNHRDGRALLKYTDGFHFESAISGPCKFSNGDRIPLYWIWDFTHDEGYPRIVAVVNTVKKTNMLETGGTWKGFEWLTPGGVVPTDTPVCGFLRELCPEIETDNTLVIIVACLSILALAAAASIIAYIIRKRQIETNMMKMIWKINIDDIELQKSRAGVGSRINFGHSMSQLSLKTSDSENNPLAGIQVMTNVGLYKGQVVAIKSVPKLSRELTRDDLIELKEMRELQHDNINPFIGACIETPSPCVLFLYCQKGSLQDILENDDIQLDMVFKNSLMLDLAEGMYYLHCSMVGCHGRLKSSNCLVDNRWVLRITDYGLNRFMEYLDLTGMEEHEYYKSMLWTAPELLSKYIESPKGTQAGDVYSFGIIIHEIFYRMGTFAGKSYMTAKDIVGRVRNRETMPCRPEVFSEVKEVHSAVAKLMQLCWIDNEFERPSFGNIRSYIKKNIHGINKNIVDIILQRLEKYASNLEDLVDQRTQQLMEEKQKTDKLLFRMLPPSCAEQLKAGEMVRPELFESATVFFSDIVGFTTIAAMSSPIQVIDLLNDLYTCFDDIIGKHDAYKVETIGDAYLVVSGIPKRNGELHAGEIADMSLHILSALMKFTPKHLPDRKINVRIGMHTGPCCAGVVGLSMPRYCLFGDTVNTASRMESTGIENRVHMSEESCKSLHRIGGYLTAGRGLIDVKGKGQMRTFWLDGKEGYTAPLPHLIE